MLQWGDEDRNRDKNDGKYVKNRTNTGEKIGRDKNDGKFVKNEQTRAKRKKKGPKY